MVEPSVPRFKSAEDHIEHLGRASNERTHALVGFSPLSRAPDSKSALSLFQLSMPPPRPLILLQQSCQNQIYKTASPERARMSPLKSGSGTNLCENPGWPLISAPCPPASKSPVNPVLIESLQANYLQLKSCRVDLQIELKSSKMGR